MYPVQSSAQWFSAEDTYATILTDWQCLDWTTSSWSQVDASFPFEIHSNTLLLCITMPTYDIAVHCFVISIKIKKKLKENPDQLFCICCRLWAEIFEVRVDGEDVFWARVSDDVVPVNITCIQDTPETVFQISAYNRHVEKIFDCKLLQPGRIGLNIYSFTK